MTHEEAIEFVIDAARWRVEKYPREGNSIDAIYRRQVVAACRKLRADINKVKDMEASDEASYEHFNRYIAGDR
jgi:hypothetical protein